MSKQEARDKGLKKYFTGKPCKHGHMSERYMQSGSCIACHYHRQKTSKKRKEYERKYNLKNKNKIKKRQKAYSQTKEYKEKQKIRDKSPKRVAYRKHHKIINRGRYNSYNKTYQVSKINRTPPWLTEYDHECIETLYVIAADQYDIYHVDHIIPLQGEFVSGLHIPENLQVSLSADNLKKSNDPNIDIPWISRYIRIDNGSLCLIRIM